MKNLKQNSLMIAGALIGAVTVNWLLQSDSPTDNYTQALLNAASEINKGLPMHVDSETVLMSTSGAMNQFSYFYQLSNYDAENIDASAFKESMEPNIRNSVCTLEGMQSFRDMKIIVNYIYADAQNKQIATIGIDTKTCNET